MFGRRSVLTGTTRFTYNNCVFQSGVYRALPQASTFFEISGPINGTDPLKCHRVDLVFNSDTNVTENGATSEVNCPDIGCVRDVCFFLCAFFLSNGQRSEWLECVRHNFERR